MMLPSSACFLLYAADELERAVSAVRQVGDCAISCGGTSGDFLGDISGMYRNMCCCF